jgi:hypothetical protein
MTISKWTVPFLVLTCAIASQAATQQRATQEKEKKLKRSELPAAVLKAVEQESQGATISGYSSEMDDGQLVYEVTMRVRGHGRDVLIGANGSVLEVEEEVTLESLPATVKDGLLHLAGSGTITKVESLTKRGILVAYEAHVRTGAKRSEIQVGPDGKPLAHPE